MRAMGRLLTAVMAVVAMVCWIAGCAKKSGREAVSETRDTLPVISDTLSLSYDTLTDTRDGKTYKTVTIGKQVWMAENLNYATSSGSWCYNNSLSYCKKYGRLYDWNTAKAVCPSGWHLPSMAEWNDLMRVVGSKKERYDDGKGTALDYWDGAGKMLKSTSGWNKDNDDNSGNGTDNYGFSALPGGGLYSDGNFGNADDYGDWWTASEGSSGSAYYRDMSYDNNIVYESNINKEIGFSVRCVGDAD